MNVRDYITTAIMFVLLFLVFSVVGPMFFVGLAATIVGCIIGAYLGKLLLKKHFQKAGIYHCYIRASYSLPERHRRSRYPD